VVVRLPQYACLSFGEQLPWCSLEHFKHAWAPPSNGGGQSLLSWPPHEAGAGGAGGTATGQSAGSQNPVAFALAQIIGLRTAR
jgi:hypothetical protein